MNGRIVWEILEKDVNPAGGGSCTLVSLPIVVEKMNICAINIRS